MTRDSCTRAHRQPLLDELRRFAILAAAAVLLAVFVAAAAAGAGRADPSFAPRGPLPVGEGTSSVGVADVNGDSKPDLVVAKRESNDVTVLLGDGVGSFHTADGSPIAVGRSPESVAVADFNGDRKADLAVANAGSSDLTVLLGNGTGVFRTAAGSPIKVAGLLANITASDLNGDGNVDLVAPLYDQNTKTSRVTILLGDGSAGFVQAPGSPLILPRRTYGSALLAAADFNGDRKPDLAVAFDESSGVWILLGDGAGGFGAATTILAGTPSSLVAADLNRDGKADLAVTRRRVIVLLGNGTGAFRAAAGSPIAVVGEPSSLAVADFNGDGKPDLAVAPAGVAVPGCAGCWRPAAAAVLLGNGAGGFRPAADSPFAGPEEEIAAAADFNGDGKPDLALDHLLLFQTATTPLVVRGRAGSGRADATFSTTGVITELAADGARAAVVTSIKGTCGRILVWTAPGRKSTSFKLGGCGSILCGTACAGNVALGGGQVAWIEESGGNSHEFLVMAAKLSRGAAKLIEHAANGNGAGGDPEGGYIGQLLGGGPLLAYNSWQVVCSHDNGDYCDRWGLAQKKLVRIASRRAVVIKRGAGACLLAAVAGGRMAVTGSAPWWGTGVWTCSLGADVASAGAVTILAPSGSHVATVPVVDGNPPRAIALSRTRLAVLRTFTLDLYDPATGAKAKSLPLGPAAALRLAGITSKLALLRGLRRLVLVRLNEGKLISLPLRPAAATSLVDAKLTEAGLFYAYNTPRATAKGRIVFEPTAKLVARF